MIADAEFDDVLVYAIPMRTRFRGTQLREGVLLHGPAGWGEFCPFDDYDDIGCVPWYAAALEQSHRSLPQPVRSTVPVSCIVPAVGPDHAAALVVESGCTTAKVKVADRAEDFSADLARVAAVRAALGSGGRIRVDANGVWDVDTAVSSIKRLNRAAGGLEFVEQPCRSIPELAAVRRRVVPPVAADESIRRGGDPAAVAAAAAADVAVIKAAPLGGVDRALAVARSCGLDCVVSSAVETSVGLTAELALAAALPELRYACGLDTVRLLTGDVVAPEYQVASRHGWLTTAQSQPPLDRSRADRYRQSDPARSAWWLARLERVGSIFHRGATAQ